MSSDAQGPRVLLVEDEPMNARLALDLLRDHLRCRVTHAADGRLALHAAARGGFDVILMDVRLPSMDGLEVARRIACIERRLHRRRTPMVAVTGSVMPWEVEACFAAGVDDVLPKPYRIDDFVRVVRRWSANAQMASLCHEGERDPLRLQM